MGKYSKGKYYRDLQEDEYIYNALVNLSDAAKKRLSPQEVLILKSKSSIRTFVSRATIDRKNVILAKAGIHYVKFYIDMNQEDPLNLEKFGKLEKQFSNTKDRKDIIEAIIKGNIFATSSREVLAQAYLVAQNCHTPYFFLNMSYKKVYSAVQDITMKQLLRYDGETDAQKVAALETSRNVIAQLILAVWDSESYIRVHDKLQMIDVHLLIYLFLFRDSYIENNSMYRHMSTYAKSNIRNRLFALEKEGYISSLTNAKIRRYTINELGILHVCDMLELITKKALNS